MTKKQQKTPLRKDLNRLQKFDLIDLIRPLLAVSITTF